MAKILVVDDDAMNLRLGVAAFGEARKPAAPAVKDEHVATKEKE